VIDRWNSVARPTRVILVLGTILLLLAASGVLRADRGIGVSSDQAVEIARQQVDFVSENTQVRLIRQGFNLRPVWAVSLAIPIAGTGEFERLTTVEVDAITGAVLRVVTSDG
jgi:hypothetical protein